MPDDLEKIGLLAEYIARADELKKLNKLSPDQLQDLDTHIKTAYSELKGLHPAPEEAIEETWDNIAELEDGKVLPLKEIVSFDKWKKTTDESLTPGKEPDVSAQVPTIKELTEQDMQSKLLDLLQNFSLESKTPDAPKQTKVFRSKSPDGTTNYTDDERMANFLAQYQGGL